MSVELDHSIIWVRDKHVSAAFLAQALDLTIREPDGPFLPVLTANGVALDFGNTDAPTLAMQHYAFRVSGEEFEGVTDRLRAAGVPTYSEPGCKEVGIYVENGTRGAYFLDPDRHVMEILTPA